MSSLRSRSLRDLLTFTRASVGSYCNAEGVLASAAVNVPRVEYDPTTLAVRGLLIEQTRTNYLLRSQEFDHATWGKVRATVSSERALAPDGTLTSDQMIEDTTVNDSHYVSQTYTKGSSTESQAYAASVWVKAAGRTQLRLLCLGTSGTFNSAYALFDLTAGTASAVTVTGAWDNTAARIEAWPNGWYRCILEFRINNDGQAHVSMVCAAVSGGNVTYTGNGSSGLYLWGAQLEKGAHASSYIATTSATVTRAVDVCSTTQLAPWFNQQAGTMLVEYLIPSVYLATENGAGRYLFQFDDGTNNNRHVGYINVGQQSVYSEAYAVTQVSLIEAAISPATVVRIAYAWAENDCGFAQTGQAVVTDTAAFTPVGLTAFRLGAYHVAGNELDGYIRKAKFYPRRLSNTELAALVA